MSFFADELQENSANFNIEFTTLLVGYAIILLCGIGFIIQIWDFIQICIR